MKLTIHLINPDMFRSGCVRDGVRVGVPDVVRRARDHGGHARVPDHAGRKVPRGDQGVQDGRGLRQVAQAGKKQFDRLVN